MLLIFNDLRFCLPYQEKLLLKNWLFFRMAAILLFRISSAVEQWTVNPLVAGSNPASGDSKI